jgi:hypothetical protein
VQKNSLKKGFVFTFESILTLLLFALMLYSIPAEKNFTLKELLITQQADDLLRVWSQSYPNESEIIEDTKMMFGNNAKISLNGKEILNCEGTNKISIEGIILDDTLNENNLNITICYN